MQTVICDQEEAGRNRFQ